MRALVVDDDRNICELVRLYLDKENYEVTCCYDGKSALKEFEQTHPDIVILDLMLPDVDGYEVCRAIRKHGSTPIVMLTARTETLDKIVGLEIGADDYVAKPFDPTELIARVKAVLRRSSTPQTNLNEETHCVTYPDLVVDMSSYSCEIRGEQVDMPPKELELLYFLASHPNRVFSREQLLTQVWGYDFFGESRTVDVHVKRIREKIEAAGDSEHWAIKTVWGVGYKFELLKNANNPLN